MFVTEELLPSAPSGEEAKIIEGRPHANSPEDYLLGVRVHALQLPKEGDDKAEPPLLCGQGTPSSGSNTLAISSWTDLIWRCRVGWELYPGCFGGYHRGVPGPTRPKAP